ncbi:MAG: YopX family protein [Bacillota bacterium]
MYLEFQAYDTRRKEMETIDDLYWFEESGVHDANGNGHYGQYIFRAFTGLYDATGKQKVYHKDIIQYEGWLYVVEWDYKDTGFYLADYKHLNEPDSEEHLKGLCISQGLKMGNVFENNELIWNER